MAMIEFEQLYAPDGEPVYCKQVMRGGFQLYSETEMLQETRKPKPSNEQRNKRRQKNKQASKSRRK